VGIGQSSHLMTHQIALGQLYMVCTLDPRQLCDQSLMVSLGATHNTACTRWKSVHPFAHCNAFVSRGTSY